MPKKEKSRWLNPDKEGQSHGRLSKRYCRRCGTTIQHAPILKGLNICRFCVEDLQKRRDGIWACRGCGAIAPEQLQAHGGYCDACVCPVCGRPAPESVKETGFCPDCLAAAGAFCRSCGVEAPAQVKRNKGLCDKCALKLVSGKTADAPVTQRAKPAGRPSAPGKPPFLGKKNYQGPKRAPQRRPGEGASRPRLEGAPRFSGAGPRQERTGLGPYGERPRTPDRFAGPERRNEGRDARQGYRPDHRPGSRPEFAGEGRSEERPRKFSRPAGPRSEHRDGPQGYRPDHRPGSRPEFAGEGRSEERPRKFSRPAGPRSEHRDGPQGYRPDHRPGSRPEFAGEGRGEERPRKFSRPAGPARRNETSGQGAHRPPRGGEVRDFKPASRGFDRPQNPRGASGTQDARNHTTGGFSQPAGPGKRDGGFRGPKVHHSAGRPAHPGSRPPGEGSKGYGGSTGGNRPGPRPKQGGTRGGRKPR